MDFKKQLALGLTTLMLGVGGAIVPAQAKTQQCSSAECACEEALEKNTAEALEEYLKKYQYDASLKETACAALGIIPEDEQAYSGDADDEPEIAQPEVAPAE
jgi:hypothetical protein